jgi:amino acid adenylation domain-containing protein
MNLIEFLQNLLAQDVKLWTDGEKLYYEASQDVFTPELSAQIKQHKQEIISLLREGVVINNTFPLTYGQQALWFLFKLAPQSSAYNVAFSARICSHVDVLALRKAFQALLNRHPMLRTTFYEQNGEPIQKVHDFQEVCLEEVDASTWNEDELKRRVTQKSKHPFDLEKGPLLRVNVFHISEKEHILLLGLHHIVCDGWSLWMLLDELQGLYKGESTGLSTPLVPLDSSYKNYVNWQAKTLAASEGESLWKYWQQKLAGELPTINLPSDRPRPSVQTYQGASHRFKLTEELTSKLKELARSNGVTLYTLLYAVFQVLLYRYTGQEDILVGSPTAGRNQTDFAEIVGYFSNPVVLRSQISGDSTFKAFLAQAQKTVLEAIAHQDYPFALLVEKLQPKRDPSRSPIFQVSFSLQKPQKFEAVVDLLTSSEPKTRLNWGGLILEPFEMAQQEGEFDLTLELIETKKSLVGVFNYNVDLFDVSTIRRMVGHFQTLLEGILAHPEERIEKLPLLTAEERHQLLVEWNNNSIGGLYNDLPNKCIHELFEAQVEKTPDAIALVFENKQLTYSQLNAKANKIAHHLQALGVRPSVLVGICMERSLEMVVGVLGILKAGGSFVPLDPAYPRSRLAFMLEDAKVSILLTKDILVEKLPESAAKVVCLDWESAEFSQQSQQNLVSEVTTKNLAYVIYTSGSTGKPKGVLITHESIASHCLTVQEYYQINSQDRVLQFASLNFDTSLEQIFPPLIKGASVVLRDIEALSPQELLAKISELKISVIDLPTAYWQQMVKEWSELTDRRTSNQLRLITVGGEAMLPEYLRLWQKTAMSSVRLINAYGPTETTITATAFDVPEFFQDSSKIPIGRPLRNRTIYILDKFGNPLPIGVPGELYIGGVTLALGYLNRSDLTAQKFIPDPFSDKLGARLYKTGDLARYLPDGNIEFLGRIDDLVKIRGFRIELGEIEATLSQHPEVQQAVVTAREDKRGNKSLVAYVVLHKEDELATSNLRQYLKGKLPEYMVPNTFVILDILPLTANKKVDRKALPTPEDFNSGFSATYVAPQTELEETIATAWRAVLGLQKVGINDNFFELGGHSLLIAQTHSQLRESTGKDVSIVELFQYPTIRALADHLSQKGSKKSSFEENSQRANQQKQAINRHKQRRLQRR